MESITRYLGDTINSIVSTMTVKDVSDDGGVGSSNTETYEADPLIEVSNVMLVVTMIPLLLVARVSYKLNLKLEKAMLIGLVRSFLQLTTLGFILHPIFVLGKRLWWLVLGYLSLMILLAAYEATMRSKYYFHGMFAAVLGSLVLNVVLVSLFAFFGVLRPTPVWDPQYVIPIVGMLLGNSINAVSLSMNAMTSSLVEKSSEIELYLSFGATSYEASSRLLRDAVRIGATPQLNSLSIIGLISIPGMMTGQILGGSPVMQAARYQILIVYLIAVNVFCTIISEIYIGLKAGFDHNHTLRTEHFINREKQNKYFVIDFAKELKIMYRYLFHSNKNNSIMSLHENSSEKMEDTNNNDETSYLVPQAEIQVSIMFHNDDYDDEEYVVHEVDDINENHYGRQAQKRKQVQQEQENKVPYLQICDLMHTFHHSSPSDDSNTASLANGDFDEDKQGKQQSSNNRRRKRRIIFQDMNFSVEAGDIASVMGPSGVGKSTLLRIIAGLIPLQNGSIHLQGLNREDYTLQKMNSKEDKSERNKNNTNAQMDMTLWRQQVRYITQYKIDIPGTPQDFLRRIITFQVWRNLDHDGPPSYASMITKACELLTYWGIMDATFCLETEWKLLSGGEVQRVLLAFALASRPKVLLLDEATSNLDYETKLCIEESIEEYCIKENICVLWITHDQDQVERFRSIIADNSIDIIDDEMVDDDIDVLSSAAEVEAAYQAQGERFRSMNAADNSNIAINDDDEIVNDDN